MSSASRSGAGGKIVTNRRKKRLAATPYDRPQPPLPPPPKSPNWFTGVIVPSALAIASGAGKIISAAIFSESSSEDEDSASEDDFDNVNENEDPYDGVNALNEQGQVSQFSTKRTETKRIIEQLIRQETFSREEGDKLIKVLSSRVIDGSAEAGDDDTLNKAVLEAKKWFQGKKTGSSSGTELAHGICNLNSAAFEHVECEAGSPVDVARSYMRDRPPWASPTEHVELRTPGTTRKKLVEEIAPYSVSLDSLSSSKRRNSLASGSWNIQEELRRVRSKATEDMLRTPTAKIDLSLFSTAPSKESAGVSGMEERIAKLDSLWKAKPMDALMNVGVNFDPTLVALKSRQDGKGIEAPSSNLAASVSGHNEDSHTIQIDGEYAPSKFPYSTNPNPAGEHTDLPSTKISGAAVTEVVSESGREEDVNGFPSSQASLSSGEATVQNGSQFDKENHNDQMTSERKTINTTNEDGNCELLSEACIEVPIVTETNSIASGSQNTLGVQLEESIQEMTLPSTEGKGDIVTVKQGRKPGKSTRRGKGRGK